MGSRWRTPTPSNGKEVEVVYDDGRHFLRTTREKFDIITSDPIDPWVKGCASLNTVEYYQMCRDHLNPGGIVSLWIPLNESDLDTTKSLIATFFQVFPNGILWSNERERFGYDAILFGQVEPTVIDVDALQRRLVRPDHQAESSSLSATSASGSPRGFEGEGDRNEGIELLATYAGPGPLAEGVVGRGPDQHRPEPQAPVSRRDVVQLLPGGCHPFEHPGALPLPRPDLRRQTGNHHRSQGGSGPEGADGTQVAIAGSA